jgi:rhodanese-related sulfurtransferase
LRGKILALPDSVQVYPAHGAGSMCGRNISADRSSTIGRERQSNYALQPMSREQFVEMMTHDLPARPEYFAHDVDVNRHGAPALGELALVAHLAPEDVERRRQVGVTILDTRPAMQYCSGHVPGSISIGLSGQFASWAGALIGLDRELILVADDDQIQEARVRLARVGIERVAGVLDGGIASWVAAGLPLAHTEQTTVAHLAEELAANPELGIIDVRRPGEWNQGHIGGAALAPLDSLPEGLKKLDAGRTTAVYCRSGYRSAIACSILEAAGFTRVINVLGGFDAWSGAGLGVMRAGA